MNVFSIFFVTVGLNQVTWAFSRSEMFWGLRVPVRGLIPEALGGGRCMRKQQQKGTGDLLWLGQWVTPRLGLGHGESLVGVELVHLGQG